MPLVYGAQTATESVLTVRKKCGLFDVSHMGQIVLGGADRAAFLESLTATDVLEMPTDSCKLSCFLTSEGGIIDDVIITARQNTHTLVVNAANLDKDIELLQQALDSFPGEVFIDLSPIHNRALLALQGPQSAHVLKNLLGLGVNLRYMDFMTCLDARIADVPVTITRCGYTGLDGFEISVPHAQAEAVAQKLIGDSSAPEVSLAGLVARDMLQIEAGLCLYGKEIDETVTPVEAGLGWTIGKRRRREGGFPGDEIIVNQLEPDGVSRKRVGLIVGEDAEGILIAREGCTIKRPADSDIGNVTSGTFSPWLKQSVAMGYVDSEHSKIDTQVEIEIRDKLVSARVVALPFVPHQFYRAPKE